MLANVAHCGHLDHLIAKLMCKEGYHHRIVIDRYYLFYYDRNRHWLTQYKLTALMTQILLLGDGHVIFLSYVWHLEYQAFPPTAGSCKQETKRVYARYVARS